MSQHYVDAYDRPRPKLANSQLTPGPTAGPRHSERPRPPDPNYERLGTRATLAPRPTPAALTPRASPSAAPASAQPKLCRASGQLPSPPRDATRAARPTGPYRSVASAPHAARADRPRGAQSACGCT